MERYVCNLRVKHEEVAFKESKHGTPLFEFSLEREGL